MVTQIRNLDFLPEIFRTKPNEQFLSQTLDVLTSKPDLTRVEGFIGENYGIAVAPTDRYVVEPTSERQNYQLTPAVTFLKNSTQIAKDFIDYPNIIRALGNQGALTDNHDRLFSNEFYAWDSFIDLDKFVNYSQYFWLPLGPDAIDITDALNVTTDIIGKTQFTSAAGVKFVNGLKVKFTDLSVVPPYLDQEFYVEGVGDSIQLVPVNELKVIEPTGGFIYLPWQPGNNIEIITDNIDVATDIIGQAQYTSPSGLTFVNGMGVTFTDPLVSPAYLNKQFIISGVGSSIQLIPASGSGWANLIIGWDVQTQIATNVEYLLINRNSRDRNAWSRTNRWFSQEVLDITAQFNGQLTTNTANLPVRARRPIIEYYGNLSLFNSGSESLGLVDYVDTTTTVPSLNTLGTITINNGTTTLLDGATVIFINATSAAIRETVYTTVYVYDALGNFISTTLTPTLTAVDNGLIGVAYGPSEFAGVSLLSSLNASGEIVWTIAQTKTEVNQYPLFDIFDRNDVSYSDQTVYPNSTFAGNKLFSYTTGTGVNDSVLGFPISYSKLTNLGDINFTINLNTDSFVYGESNNSVTKAVSTGLVHQSLTTGTFIRKTGWVKAAADSVQYQVFNFTIDASSTSSVKCDILIDTSSVWQGVQVYLNGEVMPKTDYTVTSDTTLNTTTVIFNNTLDIGDGITVLLNSKQVSKVAYYQVPTNLQNNPFNTNMSTLTAGDIRRHYSTIFTNAPGVTGQQFGANNIANLGDLTSYGTSIIQSSAPLVLPGVFLRKPDYNLIDALRFNSIEYEKYKALIIDTAYNGDYSVYQTPAQVLDHIIYRITDAKSSDGSFFWSDMLPFGSPINTIKTTVALPVATITTALSITHDYANANYNGLSVYVNRIVNSRNQSTQLVKDRDYTVTGNSLTVNYLFLTGDVLLINEYNQTYGSYVPNTPTKLGMYQATIPAVVTDNTYYQPISFIVGHDGSYTKLYGNYVAGVFDDFRDMALFEFETRVYNNLKVDSALPLSYTDIFPGQFRTTDYTRNELLTAYAENFLAWVGRNRVDYRTQVYNSANEFTYNYNKSANRLTGDLMDQGYWRGIYRWLYDTTNPADAPWEMLGFTTKPTWWDAQYGAAPYLSTNTLMWGDIEAGFVRGTGETLVEYTRPGLSNIIPVDTAGVLVSPFISIIGNYTKLSFERSWVVGDEGPTESTYLRSSTWAFDQMALLSISKPAKFYNFYADRDNYKYDNVLGQYLYNGRTHIDPRTLEIYGAGTAKHSYINWVVDYINQWGIDGKTDVDNTLANLDVRLAYRIAGFSDKQYLRFFIERSTPTSTTPRLLIPDASYDVLLHDNPPEDKITYSSVIIQKTDQGYTVWGNSTTSPFFKVATQEAGPVEKITVGSETINVGTAFSSTRTTPVAYGTLFYSLQGVCEFMRSYGVYLENSGVIFDNITDGSTVGWTQMIREFINWAQQTWEVGSTLSLNPSATNFGIMREGLVVQPLTMSHDNFILNQNQVPLQQESYKIDRNNEEFRINVLSVGDAIAYTNLHLNSIEHAVIFNNITEFSDVIYDLEAGLRQNRIVMSGKKTAGWSGFVKTNGFILNEGDIALWDKNTKYNKGQIVEFKNAYYSAQELIQPGSEFDYSKWVLNNYAQVKVGLLPNPTTRAYEATKFYDITDANLSQDEDLLAFGLIGFRPRQYMTDAELSDISQVNLYINMIRNKGTITSADAFKNANLTQGPIDYDIRENWAIKNGEFGATGNNQFVEFELSSDTLTGNPAIISFATTGKVAGAQQTVAISTLINYYNKPTAANILPPYSTQYSIERGLPTAGYVNKNDIKITAYDFESLNLNLSDLSTLYVGDYIWVANYQSSWAVFTPQAVPTTISTLTNNLNGTINITFATAHGLVRKNPIAIIDFDSTINGYYIVDDVVNLQTITVVSSLSRTVNQLTGTGIALKLVDVRAKQASDFTTRTITGTTKFNTRLSWADSNTENDWRVWATEEVYKAVADVDGYQTEYNGGTLGTRVAHSTLIGDLATIDTGEVYRNGIIKTDNLGRPIKAEFGMRVVGNTLYCATLGPGVALLNRWDIGGWNVNGVGWNGVQAGSLYPLIKVYNFVGGQFFLVDTIDPGLAVTSVPPMIEITDFAVSEDKDWVYISNANARQVYTFKSNKATNKYDYDSTVGAITGYGSEFKVTVEPSQWGTTGWNIGKYNVQIINGGRKYVEGDYIRIPGSDLFGLAFENDLIIEVISVDNNGAITGVTSTGMPIDRYSATVPISVTFVDNGNSFWYESDRWGYSIDTNYDGTKVIIGVPRKSLMGMPAAGFSEIYSRANEKFIQSGTSNTFVTQSPIPTIYQTNYNVVPLNLTGVGTSTTLAVYYEVGTTNVLVDAKSEGVGYVVGDNLIIPGTAIGALSPSNDINITVSSIDVNGAITSVSVIAPAVPFQTTLGNPEILINGVETTAYTLLSDANETVITLAVTPVIGDEITVNYGTLTLQQRTQRLELSDGQYVAQPENGALYGHSVATNKLGAEMMVGCPYGITVLLTNEQTEGAVYRWTNTGQRYGQVTATIPSSAVNETILINGYKVELNVSETTIELAAIEIAKQINLQEPTNVSAVASGNQVLITVSTTDSSPGDILDIVGTAEIFTKFGQVWVNDSLVALGIQPYTNTQVITSPDLGMNTAFGWSIALNKGESIGDSLVVASASANGLINTTFDFSNNLQDDDTIFDHGATTFIDSVIRSGSGYMFDYLQSSTETYDNPGNYVFGQYCFGIDRYYDDTLLAGDATSRNGENISLNFNDGSVLIGTPSWYPTVSSPPVGYPNGYGRVVRYTANEKNSSWYIHRLPLQRVDVNKLNSAIIYSTVTNENLDFLDHIDPIQGKMLSVVETNIDIKSVVDPAIYTGGLVWGSNQVGTTWLDTSNIRLLNYHQTDIEYNAENWGKLFPGSTADIYVWVASAQAPLSYTGRGYIVDFESYTTSVVLDRTSNSIVTMYYFWVKGYDLIPEGKTLSPTVLSQYIIDPQSSGISYLAAITTDTIALYNSNDGIQVNGSALHLGFSTGTVGDNAHTDWTLIQDGERTDFLNGVPAAVVSDPTSLYLKYLNSFMGYQLDGLTVPDKNLPALLQHGVSFRPRQTMFVDRKAALKNYIDHANSVLIQYPITETRDTYHLQQSCIATVVGAPTENITLDTTIGMAVDQPFKFTGTLFGGLTSDTYYITSITGNVITVTTKIGQPSTIITADGSTQCNLWYPMNYVTEVDWWAKGYDSSTKAMFEMPTYSELLTVGNGELYSSDEPLFLTLYDGLIARVKTNGRGKSETYIWKAATGWVRIGLERGTYQISEMIYGDPVTNKLKFGWEKYGWSNVGWDRDTVVSIITPANEIYRIVRWLTEQVYISDLQIENNRSLMLMFSVIQSQSNQQANFLPWLNKTSLIDVSHVVRELKPFKRYQFDNAGLVSGYLNEVKPYHVYIKNFVYKYTVNENVGVEVQESVSITIASPTIVSPTIYSFSITMNTDNQVEVLSTSGQILPTDLYNKLWSAPVTPSTPQQLSGTLENSTLSGGIFLRT